MKNFPFDDFAKSGAIISKNPNQLLIGWGKTQWFKEPEEKAPLLFYFPDFFLDKPKPWVVFANTIEMTISDFLAILDSLPKATPPRITWQNLYETFYQEQFHHLQHLFAEGILEKAVPFVYESAQTKMSSPLFFSILKHALAYIQNYPLYLYGFWEKNEGILGATPELLFHLRSTPEGQRLSTLALAGTHLGSDAPKNPDPKLLHEHQVVIDGIIQSLSKFGKVNAKQLQWLRLATLSHLYTAIEVDLKTIPDFISIVSALHPTPALGAFPREEGEKWLRYYEKLIQRRQFGAPAGFKDQRADEAKCYVAIRNIQWTKNQLLIGGGGGVVKESSLGKEWKEIRLKIDSIKRIFFNIREKAK